jgi:hypothetical protein
MTMSNPSDYMDSRKNIFSIKLFRKIIVALSPLLCNTPLIFPANRAKEKNRLLIPPINPAKVNVMKPAPDIAYAQAAAETGLLLYKSKIIIRDV